MLCSLFSPHVQDKNWSEVMETHQKLPTNQLDLRKQQEAVWELFTSECTYFLDHLLVLKMVMLVFIFLLNGKYSVLWCLVFLSMLKKERRFSPLSVALEESFIYYFYQATT